VFVRRRCCGVHCGGGVCRACVHMQRWLSLPAGERCATNDERRAWGLTSCPGARGAAPEPFQPSLLLLTRPTPHGLRLASLTNRTARAGLWVMPSTSALCARPTRQTSSPCR
jgi:hypothetical protein